eukprot:TRINITY_DN2696_c0_g1_i1.p1 TRINITY_DN2696_c0_g1~~TRINITY_DN2696_c0_g1_i1.p1  ORF type:complete len:555 (-),score=158.64 TRINITY_DN2696_c0_g1_i1:136-1800(-)
MRGHLSLVLLLGILSIVVSLVQGQQVALRGVAVADSFFVGKAKPTFFTFARILLNLQTSDFSVTWTHYGEGDLPNTEVAVLFAGGVKGAPLTPLFLIRGGQFSETYTDLDTLIRFMAYGEITFITYTTGYPNGIAKGELQLDTSFFTSKLIPTFDMLNGQQSLPGNVGRVFLGVDPSLPAPLLYLKHSAIVGISNLTVALLNSNGDIISTLYAGVLKSPVLAHLTSLNINSFLNDASQAKYLGVLDSSSNPLLLSAVPSDLSGGSVTLLATLKGTQNPSMATIQFGWSQAKKILTFNATFSNLSSVPDSAILGLKYLDYQFLQLDLTPLGATSGTITGNFTLDDGQANLVALAISINDLAVYVYTAASPSTPELTGLLKAQDFQQPEVQQVCKGTWWVLNPNPYIIQFRYGKSKRFSSSFGALNGGSSSLYSVRASKNFYWSWQNSAPPLESTFSAGNRKQVNCFQLKRKCQNNWNFTSSDFNSLDIAIPVVYQFSNPNSSLPVTVAQFYTFPKTTFNETLSYPGVNVTLVKKVQLLCAGRVLKTVANANNPCA